MSTIQSIECASPAPDLLSFLLEYSDSQFKKASTAKHVRAKLFELIKNTACDCKTKLDKQNGIHKETHSIALPGICTLEVVFRSYNETTHVSDKKHIKTPKTFLDLNQQKSRLIKVFGQELGLQFNTLLDSVFSMTRTNFLFECEFFDMVDFFFQADYGSDYFDIEINIAKLN